METNSTFGRLAPVDLRNAWANEACHFTPWLAQPENLQLLGEALEMDLELVEREKFIGDYRADLVCMDAMNNDTLVLIENQIEGTDHGHLGQLLTYVAGVNAKVLVWIAKKFRDEHRAALDWLNENTPDDTAFFGLEVELWRIGDSPVAPKFNVVCRPNEWVRTLAERSYGNPERAAYSEEYWTGVLKELAKHNLPDHGTKPARKQNITLRVGWRNLGLKSYFSRVSGNAGVWVACTGPDREEDYAALMEHREEIQKSFGQPLAWDNNSCSFVYRGVKADDRDEWGKWLPTVWLGCTGPYYRTSRR
jgi:hypothetical protein